MFYRRLSLVYQTVEINSSQRAFFGTEYAGNIVLGSDSARGIQHALDSLTIKVSRCDMCIAHQFQSYNH